METTSPYQATSAPLSWHIVERLIELLLERESRGGPFWGSVSWDVVGGRVKRRRVTQSHQTDN